MYIHNRAVGDTLSPFLFVIRDESGEPVDLTGFDVFFKMVEEDGTEVVARTDTGVTIVDESTGQVSFDFPAEAVDEALERARGYFIYSDGSDDETYPDAGIQINVFDPSVSTVVDTTVITASDIATLAKAPKRTRTVEGTVEERSTSELIAADRYLASQQASDAVPWGIRAAKAKPPSALG